MSVEGQIAQPPRAKTLLIQMAAALIAASVIVLLFLLPAEFGTDPTGFGRATGLMQLAAPEVIQAAPAPVNGAAAPADPNALARYYDLAYRSDTIDIPLPADGTEGSELEYKVAMKTGETMTYSWSVTGDEAHPDWFYYDFHGELRPPPTDAPPKVIEYRQATGIKSSGALIAPFDGVHGWYFQNQSDKPVVVHLKVSGFYRIVPPGEYGNEAGIVAASP